MIIIPARVASSRFPNKVLANIDGYPMVIATAKRVEGLDSVAIATDSKEVYDIAKDYGFEAVMTSKEHNSGTDRIDEASEKLGLSEDEIVINVQADEPFIEPEVVKSVIDRINELKSKRDIVMVSCYKVVSKEDSTDTNLVKVITAYKLSDAIYFSRSKIPYDRDES